jgi:hypothetical protein
MNKNVIITCIVLFVVIVAGMFGFAYLKKQELQTEQQQQTQTNSSAEQVKYADITRITAKHFFIDGEHTLVGEIPMPTPCDLIESSARVMESMPEQITVDFTVLNTADSCVQQITNQRFQVEATASKDATFSATFMGRPVELNLIPAAPGEKPEDFELFIKG